MNKLKIFTISIILFQFIISQSLQNYGLKTGLASTKQDYKNTMIDEDDYFRRNGLYLAVFKEWQLKNKFLILTQLEFVQKGTKTDYMHPIGDIRIKSNFRANYIVLPVLLKMYINKGKISPYLFAGPNLNYLFFTDKESEYFYDDFKKANLGVSFGFGIIHEIMKNRKLILEFRYDTNIFNDMDVKNDFSGGRATAKNSSLFFIIGMMF